MARTKRIRANGIFTCSEHMRPPDKVIKIPGPYIQNGETIEATIAQSVCPDYTTLLHSYLLEQKIWVFELCERIRAVVAQSRCGIVIYNIFMILYYHQLVECRRTGLLQVHRCEFVRQLWTMSLLTMQLPLWRCCRTTELLYGPGSSPRGKRCVHRVEQTTWS